MACFHAPPRRLFGRRAGRAPATAQDLPQRVAGLYERLLLATPPEQRDAIIVEALSDPLTPVVAVGLRFADREISAGRSLSENVVRLAGDCLGSADASNRAAAAALLVRIGTDTTRQRLRERLADETDPTVAAILLGSVARSPNPDAADAVVAWCARRTGPDREAFDAAEALYVNGMLSNGKLGLAVGAARAKASPEASGSVLRFLVRTGTPDDAAGVRAMLASLDAAVRLKAARALAVSPDALGSLFAAAGEDSALLPIVQGAVHDHGVTADRLRRFAQLPGATGGRPAPLERLAAELPAAERVRLASDVTEPVAFRVCLLRSLAPGDASRARNTGLCLLAELMLVEGRVAEAREAFSAIGPGPHDLFTTIRLAVLSQRLTEAEAGEDADGAESTDAQAAPPGRPAAEGG